MMAERAFLRTASPIVVILLVICVNGSYGCGGSSNHYTNTYYTEVSEVSPDEVAERLTPKLQEMANDLVHETAEQSRQELEQILSWLNSSKEDIEEVLNNLPENQETLRLLNNLKSSIEAQQQQMQNNRDIVVQYVRENGFISRYIGSLCRLIYEDVRGQAMTLREIMVKIIQTYDMTERNSEKLDDAREAIADNQGEVLKVEDETFAIYDLLVKIEDTLEKEENMWTTGQVELIAFSLAGAIGFLVLALVYLIVRHHTKMELKWRGFCANAQDRFKEDLRTNNAVNRDISCVKKNLEYVNPLVTKGPDNYF